MKRFIIAIASILLLHDTTFSQTLELTGCFANDTAILSFFESI